MVSFRELTPADAPLLARIGGTSVLESHGHSAPAAVMQAYVDQSFSVEACRAELSDPQNCFWAVEDGGETAGYFKIIRHTPHPMVPLQPVTKLERLYLLKEFYGRNLGHRLLAEAMERSKEGGDRGLWLDVWKENHRALRFYEKEGFATVGESRFTLTDTHANEIWVMWKRY